MATIIENEMEVENFLMDMIEIHNEKDGNGGYVLTQTFEEAMLFSSNRGIVITLPDGSEYQITITRSK